MSIKNGHPHRCICGSQYTTARYAAKCCEAASTDLRDGAITTYSETAELEAQAADAVYQEVIMKAVYCFECSCGEHYSSISAALHCRKCRVYSTHGYCTEVYHRKTGDIVWPDVEQLEADRLREEAQAKEVKRIAKRRANDAKRAYAPFKLSEFLSSDSLCSLKSVVI